MTEYQHCFLHFEGEDEAHNKPSISPQCMTPKASALPTELVRGSVLFRGGCVLVCFSVADLTS